MAVLFTSKERDPETGLDFFGARYMSSAQGRFTSPDMPLADQDTANPQSWNLYSYVRNNPLRAIDPTGGKCVQTSNGQADDGTGGGCEAAGVDSNGNIQAQQVSVTSKPATAQEVREAYFGPPVLSESWRNLIFGPPGVSLGMIPIGPGSSAANATRLGAQLAFEEAGILTEEGASLTKAAIQGAREIPISGGKLTNPGVVRELTKDGSRIEDWGKFTTESVNLRSGQSSQIHFYKNRVTGAVNLDVDFKVKGVVK